MDSNDETTFLDETVKYMDGIKEQPEDVEFIGSRERAISIGGWDEFKALADFMYSDGFGCEEVVTDLIIAFKDGSVMFRETYDGSKWWSFISGAGYKREKAPVTLKDPHLDIVDFLDSLVDEYRDQLEKEGKADVDEKMKELEE